MSQEEVVKQLTEGMLTGGVGPWGAEAEAYKLGVAAPEHIGVGARAR